MNEIKPTKPPEAMQVDLGEGDEAALLLVLQTLRDQRDRIQDRIDEITQRVAAIRKLNSPDAGKG